MTPRSARRTLEWLRSSLWVPAAASVTAAGTLAAFLSNGDEDGSGWRYAFGYRGSVSDANDVLIGELTALVTTMTIAFSMMLVALQVASAQFSPRLVRRWVRDDNTKVTLSVFLGTIAFALSTLLSISGDPGDAPAVAITLSMVLVLASAVSAVAYFHHISQSMRIENVMEVITLRGVADVGTMDHTVVGGGTSSAGIDPSTLPVATLTASRSGYLRGVTVTPGPRQTLLDAGVRIDVTRCRGDWVAAGEVYAELRSSTALDGSDRAAVEEAVARLVDLADDRPFDIEVDLAIRLLVDIAIKAISPAVNDPYTAVQAVQHLRTLVLHVARSVPDVEAGTTTVLRVPVPSFDDRLTLACEQIVRSADRSPTVLEAVLELLGSVSALAGRATSTGSVADLTAMVAEVASELALEHDRRHLADLLDAFPDLPTARALLL